MQTITFTPARVERLRNAFCEACERFDQEFDFDGYRLATGYVKYLLDYLDQEYEALTSDRSRAHTLN
jgi:hypothetical protein